MPYIPILLLILPSLTLPILIFLIVQRFIRYSSRSGSQTIGVIVLGDAEQSPRTTSHVLSLLSSNYNVHLLAYRRPPSSLLKHPQAARAFAFTQLPTPTAHAAASASRSSLLYVFSGAFAFLKRGWYLFRAVGCYGSHWSVVLVQNPPCVPVYVVMGLGRLVFGWKVLIDWHNLAWTIMKESGVSPAIVSVAKVYEHLGGRAVGDMHMCVSEALRRWLAVNVGIEAKVIYDRPRGQWVPREMRMEREQFIYRIAGLGKGKECREWKKCKVRVVVSSTSWTPDEDFGILLDALMKVDTDLSNSDVRLVMVITGRGPLKNAFEQALKEAKLERVLVRLSWLSHDDYLKLLRAADLGISLHKSSSGLDLPMKVVDMFGCGLPVLSYQYKTIEELVLDGKNGFLFGDSVSLASLIIRLLGCHESNKLQQMRYNVEQHFCKTRARWDICWESTVLPVFEKLCS